MKLSPKSFDVHGNPSPGEQRLFKTLSEASNSPNWLVFHSLEIAEHKRKPQGEADFVFLIPGMGVLVIEVKDHNRVQFDGHDWILGNKRETRGPFKQADDAKWSLRQYLTRRGIDLYDVPFVHAVWFTSLPKNQVPESMEWTKDQVFTVEDLEGNIASNISKKMGGLIEQTGISFSANRAPAERLEAIGQSLRPRFVAQETPDARTLKMNQFLESALETQISKYRIIKPLRAVLLDGLAGTGKTFIAEHIAREANEEREKTLFVCFNKLLAEQIKVDLADCDYVEVSTIHALMLRIAGLRDGELRDTSDGFWKRDLPLIALEAAERLDDSSRFTSVIIDEAQDLGMDEYLLFLSSVIRGGFNAAKRVFAVGDFAHQGLYADGNQAMTSFLSLEPSFSVLALERQNCRNTREVGEFVNDVADLDPEYDGFLRSDRQGGVSLIEPRSTLDAKNLVLARISEERGRYQEEQIVILTNNRGRLEDTIEAPNVKFKRIGDARTGGIKYGTVHEFKGLESHCVFYVEFDNAQANGQDVLYVAATRTLGDFIHVLVASGR